MLRVIALFAVAVAAHAQSPSADWRTITTAHFRVEYPRDYEAWATRAASRLESIRAAVVKEIGFDPPQTIEVIVSNPVSQANGEALPFLDTPRVIFWTQPPGPEEQIGAYSDWIDLLATHELTHTVHMLRPSRNSLSRLVELLLPLNPITLSAPRWVLEGYATVIEGRLTGAGRPPSAMRAAILREWASTGRMPSYSLLNSDSRFLGLSMAYLAGSAYLEWLEKRTGEGSLRHLWARMTARQRRSFETAFSGVFGDTPERLYGRFVAELTASALAVNRSTQLREGEWWQSTTRASGDPAVSPDGSQIAIVLRPREEPAQIVIWSTAPPVEEERKFAERLEAITKRDPEDVAPVRSKPLRRKVVHSFRAPDGREIDTPRWTRNGEILYVHRQPDRQGFLHLDLFLWNPNLGTNRRVTRLGDVYDADPFLNGRTAVAVRSRFGLTQLVQVGLDDGDVRELTPPSLETVYSHPRVSPDGTRIAYVAHRQGTWSLFVRDVATGSERAVVSDVNVASPEWSGNDIIATVLSSGFADINRIQLNGEHQPLTRSAGASFQPAPAGDRVFFMGLDPDGFQLRMIDANTTAPPPPPYDAALVPALPLTIPPPPQFATQPASAPRAYGIGRQEAKWLIAETFAPQQGATELGVRFGDVIGRLDTIALASIGRDHGQRGLAIASSWRGWPIDVNGHVFTGDDRFVKRNGMELRGSWSAQTSLAALQVDGGAITGKPLDLGFAAARFGLRQVLTTWRANEDIRLSAESGTMRHYRGVIRASLRRTGLSVTARYQHDEVRGDGAVDVGGVPSSIVPLSATPARVFEPALPVATLSGRRYNGARLETTVSGFPATFFYQHHRVDRESMSVAGIVVTFNTPAAPLLRYPGLDFLTGVARTLDEPLRNHTKWWFSMRWRP